MELLSGIIRKELPKPFVYTKDLELITSFLKEKDQQTLAELFIRYSALVYGVCLKYLKDREEARDATMTIFEKMPAKLEGAEIQNFKAWLYVLTRNHCLMAIRSQKGKFKQEFNEAFMENALLEHPEEETDIEPNLSKLEKCIQTLNDEQKECVKLFYLEERCYQEVSETTGYDMNKVKSYIQNGKRNLKICMDRND